MPLICRHNRFTAECPICAKGTVLDPDRKTERRPRPAPAGGRRAAGAGRRGSAAATVSRGPYAAAGPYEGGRELRLERVPGGLRLAAWLAGQLERRAPELRLSDLEPLVTRALELELFGERDANRIAEALAGAHAPGEPGAFGASPGRTGELRDELRVERIEERELRLARWILRPNAGWQLQEAPVMLPGARFAEALASAAARGVLAPS